MIPGRGAVAAVVVAFLVSGCASSLPVAKYASLSRTTEKLSATMTRTSEMIEHLQRRFVVATAADAPITPEAFQPRIGATSFDLRPALRFREAALDVVVRYTAVLEALSCKDYLSDVDEASQDLAASARNFAEQTLDAPGGEASTAGKLIGTLVDVVARQAIEQRRREGLRQAMDAAQPGLDSLAPLIASSCARMETAVDLMRDRILAHANVTRPPFDSPARYAFDYEMASFLDDVSTIHASLKLLARGMAKLPQAHREIRLSLDEPATPRVALEALIEEGQRAKELLGRLNAE